MAQSSLFLRPNWGLMEAFRGDQVLAKQLLDIIWQGHFEFYTRLVNRGRFCSTPLAASVGDSGEIAIAPRRINHARDDKCIFIFPSVPCYHLGYQLQKRCAIRLMQKHLELKLFSILLSHLLRGLCMSKFASSFYTQIDASESYLSFVVLEYDV